MPADTDAALTGLGLTEAARLLRSGELTAAEYAEALIGRCERQAALGAFIGFDAGLVRAGARAADLRRAAGVPAGTLHGVPIAVKDNVSTLGLPTTGGTAALVGNRPDGQAVIAARLAEAGAIVLGKTNLHELSMGWTGNNPTFGPVRNPYLPDRIAGGSSGGSACAVAARMTPAAIGTDTNGSIRIPAALCGVAGMRPTTGRYPMSGVMPLAPSLDTAGPIARSVADLAVLDAVLARTRPAPPRAGLYGVRVGVSPAFHLRDLHPEVERMFGDTLAVLAAAGAQVVEAEIDGLDALTDGVAAALIRHESSRALPEYLARHAPGVSMRRLVAAAGADLAAALAPPEPADAARYRRAVRARARLRSRYRRHVERNALDVVVHPVVAMPAPPVEARFVSPAPPVRIGTREVPSRVAYGRAVALATVAGLPALVLPAGLTSAGLPVAIEINALPGHDEELIGIGFAVESALGPTPAPGLH